MDKQLGMAEFFAMEAGEYLDRLDALVSAAGVPNADELQRLTRALRGAALMANQQPIATVAGAFEQVARAVREKRRTWDEPTRQLTIQTVDDLRRFLHRVREWTEADTEDARGVTAALEQVGGRVHAPRASGAGPDAGTRAFVAREGAALANALARAADALGRNPHATDALEPVRTVMLPLRGLATLRELPPLPDLLEAIDRATAVIHRGGDAHGNGASVLDGAAKALTQATREVTSEGRADPEGVEVRRFVDGIRRLLGLDAPAVPIESLYFEDAGPHVVEPGASPPSGPRLGDVELVALGEHLKQVATGVGQATSTTLRMLRGLTSADTLRTLELNADEHLLSGTRAFARAGRDALARGLAASHPEAFAGALRSAGEALAGGSVPGPGLSRELTRLAAALESAGREGTQPAAARPAAPPPAAEAPAAAAAGAGGEEQLALETGDLAGSLQRYHRYVATLGLGPPALEELLSGPPADPLRAARPDGRRPTPAATQPAPRAAQPVEAATPVPVAAAAPSSAGVTPISELTYRGPDALRRVLQLRERARELVAAGVRGGELTEIIEEIFDLVQLGLADA